MQVKARAKVFVNVRFISLMQLVTAFEANGIAKPVFGHDLLVWKIPELDLLCKRIYSEIDASNFYFFQRRAFTTRSISASRYCLLMGMREEGRKISLFSMDCMRDMDTT